VRKERKGRGERGRARDGKTRGEEGRGRGAP